MASADGVAQTLLAGVVAAHDPLQLGKFADHAGGEISLAEMRGLCGEVRVGADKGRELARQRLDALHALVHRAELGVEGDALEPLQPFGERDLAVLVPEEAGVVQARRQHPRIARPRWRLPPSLASMLAIDDEVGREARAQRVAHREVALVRAHGGADHLGR